MWNFDPITSESRNWSNEELQGTNHRVLPPVLVELKIIQMKVHAWATFKRHDRTVRPVVCRLWIKPQTCDFHDVSLILFQLDRLQLTSVYCNRREVWRQHLTRPLSQCESLQGIRVQVRNWINWYSYIIWIVDTKCRAKSPTICEVTWNTWEICERSWCQCMSHHALKILRFSLSLFFVVS